MTTRAWNGAFGAMYRQRWNIWLVAVLAHTLGLFHRAALAPMADQIMVDFNVTAAVFGALGAIYFFIYAAMQLPAGDMADRLGPRKTITAGLVVSTAGSLIMGLAPSFGVLLLGRVLVTLGVSVVYICVIKLVMAWFRSRELASITGASMALGTVGQMAATIPLAFLVTIMDWRVSFIGAGLLGLALAAGNWLMVKDSPDQVGLAPISETEGRRPASSSTLDRFSRLTTVQRFKMTLGNKHLWPLFFVALGAYGSYAALFSSWAVIYLMQAYHLERVAATNFVFIATVGLIVGTPLAGVISDRILQRRRLTSVLFTSLSLSSFLFLTFWNGARPPVWALYPLCFTMGLGVGALPINFAVVREVVHPALRGLASGLVNMGGFVGAALLQPVFGYLLDLGWQGQVEGGVRVYPAGAYQTGLILCCALVGLSLLGALMVKETHCQETWHLSEDV
jgi:sugar phosphate permease